MLTNNSKLAFNSELFVSEITESFSAGGSIIGFGVGSAIFEEPYNQDHGSRWATKYVDVSVPEETKSAFLYLGDHYLEFGDKIETFDRPLTHFGIRYGFAGPINSGTVKVKVDADLSDRNADDQWMGKVEVVVVCLG